MKFVMLINPGFRKGYTDEGLKKVAMVLGITQGQVKATDEISEVRESQLVPDDGAFYLVNEEALTNPYQVFNGRVDGL